MTEKEDDTLLFFSNNKPLYNSILAGSLYVILLMSANILLLLLLFFLPGILFPLTTSYFQTRRLNHRSLRVFLHLLLSVTTHYSCTQIAFPNNWDFSPVAAGFAGSFIYLSSTKYLLKKQLEWVDIALVSVLGGCVFIPWVLDHSGLFPPAFALFSWTVINGWLLNQEYRIPKEAITA